MFVQAQPRIDHSIIFPECFARCSAKFDRSMDSDLCFHPRFPSDTVAATFAAAEPCDSYRRFNVPGDFQRN